MNVSVTKETQNSSRNVTSYVLKQLSSGHGTGDFLIAYSPDFRRHLG